MARDMTEKGTRTSGSYVSKGVLIGEGMTEGFCNSASSKDQDNLFRKRGAWGG
jgi:hypothetical protein